ncbi:MAG: hypothetical protein KME26_27955 [Oscillatoria princeps RMCB-10]|nr:hypothetical protein [Oscillatoria princeps RMCB-10]
MEIHARLALREPARTPGESKGVLYLNLGRLSHRQQSKIWQLAGVSSNASAPAPPARSMAVVD